MFFVRPFRPTALGLADLAVKLGLNLRLEGIVAQRVPVGHAARISVSPSASIGA